MRFFLIFFAFLILQSFGKPKAVLICGDHICVNKAEAEQFFEKNLSIEVKIINKKKDKEVDLVELNLNSKSKVDKKIGIIKKDKTKEEVKILTNDEIKIIKKNIRKNIKDNKDKEKIKNISTSNEKKLANKKSVFRSEKSVKNRNKKNIESRNEVVDICTIIEKCSIEEISKYLLNRGNKSAFPDITTRE